MAEPIGDYTIPLEPIANHTAPQPAKLHEAIPHYYSQAAAPAPNTQRFQPPQAAMEPTGPKAHISRMWRHASLALAIISIPVAVVVIALAAAEYYFVLPGYGPAADNIGLATNVPGASVALAWDCAELITICARPGRRGIHPGAHVGVNLVLWLGIGAGAGVYGAILLPGQYNVFDSVYYQAVISSSEYYYGGLSELVSAIEAILPLDVAQFAFAVVLMIVHFIYFVVACVETAHRNNQTRPAQTQQVEPQQVVYVLQQIPVTTVPVMGSTKPGSVVASTHPYTSPLQQHS